MTAVKTSSKALQLLSALLLLPAEQDQPTASDHDIAGLSRSFPRSRADCESLESLAGSHHVIMRSFPALQRELQARGLHDLAELCNGAIRKERARIERALSFLEPICQALEECGNLIVIKSLDHWPDLGNDLDLYTDADPEAIVSRFKRHFNARVSQRSWGDRLANKWNFVIPGLQELVEVHVGRLGQTGEQTTVTNSLIRRANEIEVDGRVFRVPSFEDRLIISTLQRMYRHFYIRLCDIVDNAYTLQSDSVDYLYLRHMARLTGLWPGLATYLTVISDYVRTYCGEELPLPATITSAARFRGERVHFQRNFLRIPLLPHSAGMYASELARLLLRGEIRNTLRLSLLPGLATAAALEFKLTGSDKGIW